MADSPADSLDRPSHQLIKLGHGGFFCLLLNVEGEDLLLQKHFVFTNTKYIIFNNTSS
jgi:hypothetical protein